jgi:c-di-GMP-related signal transduction protein
MGMFSLVDAIMERPMSDILGQLPLTEETKSALLGANHLFRNVLDTVVSYERGDWDGFSKLASSINLGEDIMPALYQDCMRWVDQVLRPHVGEPHKSGVTT